MRFSCGYVALMLLAVAGCNTSPTKNSFADLVDGLHARNSPLRNGNGNSRSLTSGRETVGFAGAEFIGSGSFVSHAAPVARAPMKDGSQGFELNLVNAPIAEAAKVVLGDAIGVSYVVDPRVQGTVTLQTSGPVSREALSDILETALAVNGAGIVQRSGSFRIVPLGEALSSTPSVSVPSVSPSGPGVKVQVVELQYISADEMKTILGPISREGAVLRADSTRNYVVLAGNTSDLNAMREAISVFDVDWMRGMSVAIHPLSTSDPGAIAQELETIFATQEGGAGAKLIRFVPNARLKAVLVITSRPAYLQRAAQWIAKLDKIAQTNDDQLFVYEIQNRPAKELADVLKSVLANQGASPPAEAPPSVAPDLSAVMVSADGTPIDANLSARMGIEPASAAT